MKTTVEDESERRQVINLVTGPRGWTEAIEDPVLDILLRLGAIRCVQTTSAAGWHTNFYDTVGRYEEKK